MSLDGWAELRDRILPPSDPVASHTVTWAIGLHRASWLPLIEPAYPGHELWTMISRHAFMTRLANGEKVLTSPLHLASAPVVVDGGGFSVIESCGAWPIDDEEYARQMAVIYYGLGGVGPDAWILKRLRGETREAECRRQIESNVLRPHVRAMPPRDLMCEPFMLKITGMTIADHQRLTIDSFLELCRIRPDLPWKPVLQGDKLNHYLDHIGQYRERGVDLAAFDIVFVGSMCKREDTVEAYEILCAIREAIGADNLWALGFKLDGLRRCAKVIAYADSLAWSAGTVGKQRPDGAIIKPHILLPGHDRPGLHHVGPGRVEERRRFGHKNEANCLHYALDHYRPRALEAIRVGLL